MSSLRPSDLRSSNLRSLYRIDQSDDDDSDSDNATSDNTAKKTSKLAQKKLDTDGRLWHERYEPEKSNQAVGSHFIKNLGALKAWIQMPTASKTSEKLYILRGPPGTGKTLTLKFLKQAYASAGKLFYLLDYYDQKMMQDVYELAYNSIKTIIAIDNFEPTFTYTSTAEKNVNVQTAIGRLLKIKNGVRFIFIVNDFNAPWIRQVSKSKYAKTLYYNAYESSIVYQYCKTKNITGVTDANLLNIAKSCLGDFRRFWLLLQFTLLRDNEQYNSGHASDKAANLFEDFYQLFVFNKNLSSDVDFRFALFILQQNYLIMCEDSAMFQAADTASDLSYMDILGKSHAHSDDDNKDIMCDLFKYDTRETRRTKYENWAHKLPDFQIKSTSSRTSNLSVRPTTNDIKHSSPSKDDQDMAADHNAHKITRKGHKNKLYDDLSRFLPKKTNESGNFNLVSD